MQMPSFDMISQTELLYSLSLPHGALLRPILRPRHHTSLDPRLLHRLHHFHLRLLRLRPIILGDSQHHKAVRAAEETVQPKQVEPLQRGEQAKRADLGEAALELLLLPVQAKGPDGAVLGGDGVEDVEVDVVPQVDPHRDAEGEGGGLGPVVEVVE